MKTTHIANSVLISCLMTSPVAGGETREEGSGPGLFEYHGCINCHGARGNDPVSKTVPRLGGKPADELYTNAKKILSGQGATKESQIMHAAFYSPSRCDHPPSDQDIKVITAWLASQDNSGEQLFEYHGCINCHGARGNDPVTKTVPKLAGKPAKDLYKNAKKILSGEGASKESEIMHAAFYSPSRCDHPPSDGDVEAITVWLSKQ